ncbi:hypothetical protein [Lactiplantibacillus fabifermentans]|uniref:Lipoprotein n=2 Tax=Lactiplantibacillus fabifermentans TaxID=483011 RepID=A0A0R2NPU2_9LACO|nr:hypothetical protein [Lactiplantibacillus fabifermentans]ETY74585.1 hypothetical protein LFAB_07070 [Lactiplantibacillus fabifermentans T30PCM01]KRO27703.1 hypothetical protein DY78_GL002952 [Lactiplantibacillus fabifermentans DSM 21115]
MKALLTLTTLTSFTALTLAGCGTTTKQSPVTTKKATVTKVAQHPTKSPDPTEPLDTYHQIKLNQTTLAEVKAKYGAPTLSQTLPADDQSAETDYHWKNIKMGGHFVDVGLIVHNNRVVAKGYETLTIKNDPQVLKDKARSFKKGDTAQAVLAKFGMASAEQITLQPNGNTTRTLKFLYQNEQQADSWEVGFEFKNDHITDMFQLH